MRKTSTTVMFTVGHAVCSEWLQVQRRHSFIRSITLLPLLCARLFNRGRPENHFCWWAHARVFAEFRAVR